MRHKTLMTAAILSAMTLVIGRAPIANAQSKPADVPVASPTERVTVRIALNPQNLFVVPILYGIDKGLFDRAGLKVEIVKYPGPAVTLAPMLARGDVDIAPQTPGPAFFNLVASGFQAKAIATFTSPMQGRAGQSWFTVAKSRADEFHDLKDLKGKVVETAAIGSSTSLMAYAAFKEVGLVVGKDVTTASRIRGVGDFLALAKANAQDVLGAIEPVATQLEIEGYQVRWKSLADVVPWHQWTLMASSAAFSSGHPAALRKFLAAYLIAVREINASNGAWTDTTLRLITGWTGIPADVILKMGAAPFVDPNGKVSLDSLTRSETIWIDAGELKQRTPLTALVDEAPLADALKEVGASN